MRRWPRLAPLVSLIGCTEFADPSTVVDLRVLAVSAEPSEVILDGTGLVPEIAMTALVADPAGAGRPLSLAVRACANDPAAPSAPGAGSEASGNYPAGGARSSVGSMRCPADSATSWTLPLDGGAGARPGDVPFTVRLGPEQLRAAFEADVFPGPNGHLHGGFDLGLPVIVDLTVSAGGEQVAVIKRVLFWRERLRDDQRPNRSPVITELRTYPERDPVTLTPIGATELVAPDAPRPVFAGEPIWFEPAGAQAEPYLTRIIDRFTDETHLHEVPAETLRYNFFATAGEFAPLETTSELPFGARPGPRIATESRYHPPAASALAVDPATGRRSLPVTIWVVVRDERGGASWIQRTVLVTER